MTRIASTAAVVAAFAASFAVSASAHHSTAGLYDEDVVVELTGKVKEWRFVNPHPSLVIEVERADSQMQEWDISYGGPAVTHLKGMGYTAETFKAGDVIVVRGYAARVTTAYGLLIVGHPVHPDGSPIIGSQN